MSSTYADVSGINNAVLSDNDQHDGDEDGTVPTCLNKEKINQAIEIQSSVYIVKMEKISELRTNMFNISIGDIIINKKQQTIASFLKKL